MDYIMDYLSLDPMIIDPKEFFKEDSDTLRDIIIEAATGANKDNVLSKIMKFLQRVAHLIIKGLRSLGRWIMSWFKKDAKSADQIVDDLGIDRSDNTSSEEEIIPSDIRSTVQPPVDIKSVVKDVITKFDKSNESIVLEIVDKSNFGSIGIKNKINSSIANPITGGAGSLSTFSTACAFIKNNKIIKEFANILKKVKSSGKYDGSLNNNFISLINKINEDSSKYSNIRKFVFTAEEIRYTSKELVELSNGFDEFNSTINTQNFIENQGFLHMINQISSIFGIVQQGINYITRCMGNSYIIDKRYSETINDLPTLAKFVKDMIASGLPSKYIMYNLYTIADKSIKGNKASADHPIWGQSRVVFLPDNKVVHKIAINSFGLDANKNEINVTKFLDKHGKHLVARTLRSYDDIIIDAEYAKCKPTKQPTLDYFFQMKLQQELIKLNANFILQDVHTNNIGKIGNDKVLIDYGMISRIK